MSLISLVSYPFVCLCSYKISPRPEFTERKLRMTVNAFFLIIFLSFYVTKRPYEKSWWGMFSYQIETKTANTQTLRNIYSAKRMRMTRAIFMSSRGGFPVLILAFFVPSLLPTYYAILATFGGKRPHLGRWLVAQPSSDSVLDEVFRGFLQS